MPVSPARAAAFEILLQIEREAAYASELLHASRYATLSAADHALATELVMGVLRWRSWLDLQIRPYSSQTLGRLDLEVLIALRLAAYQIGFLERVPARAAVHESVELVKRARKRSAAPFANAVLRKLASANQSIAPGSLGAETAPSPARTAERFAHPAWLVERWVKQLGPDNTAAVCRFDQSAPEVAIRVSDQAAESDLRAAGIDLAPGVLLASARRVRSGNLARTKAFVEGRIAVQDEASQLVALLVGAGERILDCCAAPGGKTRLLAERHPGSAILAVELHPHRARLLQRRVPHTNVRIVTGDIRELSTSEVFDRVLADVPCSGTGTLARHPEIKWRLRPEDFGDLQSRQVAIVQSAMTHLAPGGKLVYSTCSLENEENSEVVEKALSAGGFQLLDCRPELERLAAQGELAWPDLDSLLSGPYLRTIPGVHPVDGFFAAILERV